MTAPAHGDGSHAAGRSGNGARAIRVVVVGVPGPEVEGLLAVLGQDGSVEVVAIVDPNARTLTGGRPDVIVINPPVDGAGGPGAADCCACVAQTTRGSRPAPQPPETTSTPPATGAGRAVTCPGRLARPRIPGSAEVRGGRWACSPRESEVLAVLAEGATNPEIAARLTISEATVRSHIQNLRGKLQARSRAELVVRAFEMGLGPFDCAC
jgi:DNA-binding CsgD family transcriptional regulator